MPDCRSTAFALLIIAMLAGCVAAPPRPLPADLQQAWQDHRSALARLNYWRMIGRAGLKLGDEGGSVRVTWVDNAGQYEVSILSPLGRGLVKIRGDHNRVRLRRADGKILEGRRAEPLLLAAYGWRIPIDRLRAWALGLPSPADNYSLDQYGRLAEISGGGWRVEYREYRQFGEYELPEQLYLQRGELRINLAVSEWSFEHSSPIPKRRRLLTPQDS